jgi:hypothetical protein
MRLCITCGNQVESVGGVVRRIYSDRLFVLLLGLGIFGRRENYDRHGISCTRTYV